MQVGGSSLCCLKTAPNESVSGVLTVVATEMCLLPGRVQGSDLGVASLETQKIGSPCAIRVCSLAFKRICMGLESWLSS